MLAAQADWAIVERGWHAHVLGEAPHTFTSAVEAVKTLRVRQQGSCLRHTMEWTTEALGWMHHALMPSGLLKQTLLQLPCACSNATSLCMPARLTHHCAGSLCGRVSSCMRLLGLPV